MYKLTAKIWSHYSFDGCEYKANAFNPNSHPIVFLMLYRSVLSETWERLAKQLSRLCLENSIHFWQLIDTPFWPGKYIENIFHPFASQQLLFISWYCYAKNFIYFFLILNRIFEFLVKAILYSAIIPQGFLDSSVGKELTVMQETPFQFLGQEDSLRKG